MTENTQNQIDKEVAASAAAEAESVETVTPETATEIVAEAQTAEQTEAQTDEKPAPLSKKKQFIQILKFTAFSISAGVIQLLSFSILYDWTKWLQNSWWAAYLISIVLSVIWNFTFNRKFTFASAANVPLAMALVTVYYCMFIPVSVFGGDALEELWGEKLGIVVTVLMMIINFVTEFLWDKFLVFNDRVMKKIEGLFKRKKKDGKSDEPPQA